MELPLSMIFTQPDWNHARWIRGYQREARNTSDRDLLASLSLREENKKGSPASSFKPAVATPSCFLRGARRRPRHHTAKATAFAISFARCHNDSRVGKPIKNKTVEFPFPSWRCRGGKDVLLPAAFLFDWFEETWMGGCEYKKFGSTLRFLGGRTDHVSDWLVCGWSLCSS